jgi:hypothetical protein
MTLVADEGNPGNWDGKLPDNPLSGNLKLHDAGIRVADYTDKWVTRDAANLWELHTQIRATFPIGVVTELFDGSGKAARSE